MLISIETHRICDFPDRGSGSPTLRIRTWVFFHGKSTALCELQFEIMERPVSTSKLNTTCSRRYITKTVLRTRVVDH